MEEELWKPVEGFLSYQISSLGRVYSERRSRLLQPSRTLQGDLKVDLFGEEGRKTCSVRVLVAEAFVYNPHPVETEWSVAFDTVVVLNGLKEQVHASNLAWRPLWYAQMYARWFNSHHDYPSFYYARPVINITTNTAYQTIFECFTHEGLLLEDIVSTINMRAPARFTGDFFEWGDTVDI